jgi:RecB family exonuclease
MNGAEQQSLPGMDMERVTFLSPSALERYRLCPRLYRFLYVDGLWRMSRSSAQQAFGTSVHAALREFYRLPVGRRSLRMLLELFKRLWVRDGSGGREQQQRERERGAEALRAWYGRADTGVVPHATELGLQAAWGDVVIKGRLDRLDPDPGGGRGLVVVDYKTSRRPATQEAADADEALTIYAALVERRLGRPVTRRCSASASTRCSAPPPPSGPTSGTCPAPGPGAPAATCSNGARKASARWLA